MFDLTSLTSTLIAVFFFFSHSNNTAQSFEGSIFCMKESLADTTWFTYHIKGSVIRLDEFDKNKKLSKYTIFDLNNYSIKVVNPDKRLFKQMRPTPYVSAESKGYEIIKTQNYKNINGYRCFQWLVKNRESNTVVAYWVVNDEFIFFNDFLRLNNRTEKTSSYYLHIPDSKGYFPLLVEERSLLREFRMRTSVVEIKKQKVEDKLFSVPSDYSSFDRP